MSAIANFLDLMTTFHITQNNDIVVGNTGYLDKPVKDVLFTGRDEFGRVFINLPITITTSPAQHSAKMYAARPDRAFTIFQRYTDNNRVFVVAGEPAPMTNDNMLGEELSNFSKLEQLLRGETLRFHETMYSADYSEVFDDPDRWIEITLKPDTSVVGFNRDGSVARCSTTGIEARGAIAT